MKQKKPTQFRMPFNPGRCIKLPSVLSLKILILQTGYLGMSTVCYVSITFIVIALKNSSPSDRYFC